MKQEIYAYLFELRSIQNYLFASGKLTDTVAASDLLDQVNTSLVYDALYQCNIETVEAKADINIPTDKVMFARNAGGAIYMLCSSQQILKSFMSYWSLLISQFLPEVEFIHCIADGENAFEAVDNGIQMLAKLRNKPSANFMYASSPVLLTPRTGKAAVRQENGKGNEWLDAATSIQRHYNHKTLSKAERNSLTQKFESGNSINIHWPSDFESSVSALQFPLNDGENYVALVHIDGNGLGQLLMKLKGLNKKDSDYCALYSSFSKGLTNATQEAAQKATLSCLVPHAKPIADDKILVPARPIVLGGDDLTLIVRADLALSFSQEFIKEFEIATQVFLKALMKEHGIDSASSLPEMLTACGGIAYVKSSHPFINAHELAESLTKYAKNNSRKQLTEDNTIMASGVSFYRVTSNSSTDFSQIINDELKCVVAENDEQSQHYTFTLGNYVLGKQASPKQPNLLDLLDASTQISTNSYLSSGKLRELETLIHSNYTEAKNRFERIEELAEKSATHKENLVSFSQAIEQTMQSIPGENQSCFAKGNSRNLYSPISDILTLLSVNDSLARANA